MSAPWMLESCVEAQERSRYGSQKLCEGSSDGTIRESPDELTLRAEEVNTWKALTDVKHITLERWGSPLVDADWYAFYQALYKGIEGKD